MYNENPVTLFEPYADRLDAFAERHNLEIEKCKHDVPRWAFFSSIQKKGGGYFDIQINTKQEVFLSKYWTISDYDQLTRRSAHEPAQKIDNPLEELEDKMLEAIMEIINWDERVLKRCIKIAPGTPRQYPKLVL